MRLLCCVMLFLSASSVLAADVYRSVDENGNVIYSDRPENEGAELVFVASRTPAARPSAPAARGGRANEDADEAPEVSGGEILQEPSAAEREAERARNCTIARERAERYAVSHRLFRTLPNGEREYLSDTDIDTARAQAQADVSNWCG